MGLGFETIYTGSSIGAENLSVSTLHSTLNLAVLANIRDALVLCVIAVAEHQCLIDSFVESLNAFAPMITEMPVATILIRPVAPESSHVVWALEMGPILARLLEEGKGEAIDIGRMIGKISRSRGTGRPSVTIERAILRDYGCDQCRDKQKAHCKALNVLPLCHNNTKEIVVAISQISQVVQVLYKVRLDSQGEQGYKYLVQ